jgi:hypothetical protein
VRVTEPAAAFAREEVTLRSEGIMRPRGVVISAALVAGLLGHATSSGQGARFVTVLVRVERAEPLADADQLVPWRLVRNLAREDFQILSDSLASPIESFSTADEPISIVLVADVSASSRSSRTGCSIRRNISSCPQGGRQGLRRVSAEPNCGFAGFHRRGAEPALGSAWPPAAVRS